MSPFQHQETIRQEKETEMNTRKFLTLAAVGTVLLAPAAFYAATGAQRSSGVAEPDTMATEFLWILKPGEPAACHDDTELRAYSGSPGASSRSAGSTAESPKPRGG